MDPVFFVLLFVIGMLSLLLYFGLGFFAAAFYGAFVGCMVCTMFGVSWPVGILMLVVLAVMAVTGLRRTP